MRFAQRLKTMLRGMLTAAKLGWAIESNWTDPFLFMTYEIIRPLFGALIIVFMYKVVSTTPISDIGFAQLFVGNAFFILVIKAMIGVGQTIFEDREHYEMIRYIYLTPIGLGTYLVGRGLSKIVATTAAVVITLAVGYALFGISYAPTWAMVPYFGATMGLGIVAMIAFGIMLAAITMVTAHHGFSMAEGAAGVLFLISGVVFSIDILPSWGTAIGHLVPLTYWLEGLRRALLGTPFIESLSGMSDAAILMTLTWTTALSVIAAIVSLRSAQWLALSTGKLDAKTDH